MNFELNPELNLKLKCAPALQPELSRVHPLDWMRLMRAAFFLSAGIFLLLIQGASAIAQTKGSTPAAPTSSARTVSVQGVFLYRAKAQDTLQKIAFHLMENPTQAATLAALVSANDWAGKPQSKAGFTFEAGAPVRVPTALMLQSAAPARLLHATGEVQLLGADKTAHPPTPAAPNAAIAEGSRLILGATGRALVVFPDESRMDVQAGSSVTFTQLRRYSHTDIYLIDVQLEQGRMEASVNPKRELAGRFNVQSRRTVTGVRGTVFRVGDAAGAPAVVEVLKGEVGFSASGATVAVPHGKGSFLEPSGTPAQPVPLLAAPQWVANETSAAPQDPAAPLALRLPAGAAAVVLELTSLEAGAVTRSIALKASPKLFLPAGTPLGSYTLLAKAVDANGLHGLPMTVPVAFLARPFPPAALRLNAAKTQLEWLSDAQALLYAVEIFSTADARDPTIAMRTPHQFLDLTSLPTGSYRARVATVALQAGASEREKLGQPSEWFNFVRP